MDVSQADSTIEIVEVPEPTALEDAQHRLQDYQDMTEEMRRSSTDGRDQAARLLNTRRITTQTMVVTLKDATLRHLAATLGARLAQSCIEDALKKRDEAQKKLDDEKNWQPPSCTMSVQEIQALRTRLASLRQEVHELNAQNAYQQIQAPPPQTHMNVPLPMTPQTHFTLNQSSYHHLQNHMPSQNYISYQTPSQIHKTFSNSFTHTPRPNHIHNNLPNTGTNPNHMPPHPRQISPNQLSFEAIMNLLAPK